ncbi:MAG: FkbM family methyltransferase, partial [Alphaproteobacteria bacterium]
MLADGSMLDFVQKGLLVSYRCFRRSGLGEYPIGRAIFESCYEFYKLRFEARAINALRVYVEPGTCAIDVGANIGVITLRLAEWVGSQGKVIAIEPEATNVARLRRRMIKHGMTARVDVYQAAAAESSGTVHLALN